MHAPTKVFNAHLIRGDAVGRGFISRRFKPIYVHFMRDVEGAVPYGRRLMRTCDARPYKGVSCESFVNDPYGLYIRDGAAWAYLMKILHHYILYHILY